MLEPTLLLLREIDCRIQHYPKVFLARKILSNGLDNTTDEFVISKIAEVIFAKITAKYKIEESILKNIQNHVFFDEKLRDDQTALEYNF